MTKVAWEEVEEEEDYYLSRRRGFPIYSNMKRRPKNGRNISGQHIFIFGCFLGGNEINCLAVWKEQKHGCPQNVSEWELRDKDRKLNG